MRRRIQALATALVLLLLLPAQGERGGPPPADPEAGGWLTRQITSRVPGLGIEGLSALPGRLGAERVTLSDSAGVWLEVEGLRAPVSVWRLLRGDIRVESLTARRLAVFRRPVSEPAPADAPPGPLIPSLPSLPVDIHVGRLELPRIELREPVLGVPLTLRAEGSAALDGGGLNLSLRAAEEGGTTLALDAALRPASGPLTARAELRGPAGGPVSRLAGLPEREATLDLSLDGPASGAALTLRAAAGPGVALDVAGTVRAPDTARLGATLEGRADFSGLPLGAATPLAGPLDLRLDADARRDGTHDLRTLRLAGAAGSAEVSGVLDLTAARSALRVRVEAAPSTTFAAFLPGDVVGWAALRAEGEVAGHLAAPRVALDLAAEGFRSAIAQLATLLGPTPRATLRATAPDRIERLTVSGAALTAEASGRAGDPLDLTFAAQVAALDGAVPGLSGALSLRGTAAGPVGDPTLTLEAASDRLEAAGRVLEALSLTARVATPVSAPAVEAHAEGRFAGLPLRVNLRGGPDGEGWLRLDAAEAGFGPARLTANGRLRTAAPLFEGAATLAVPDLAPFAPLLGQPVAGAVRLEARLSGRDGAQGFEVRLDAPTLRAGGVEARRVTATLNGTPDAFDWGFSGRGAEVDAEARGRLSTEGGARIVSLAALRATGPAESIRLAAPTRVTLAPDGGIGIGATSLALGRGGTLRVEGRWGPERADQRATLAGLDLASYAALAPEAAPAGSITAEARVTGPVTAPEVTATVRGTGLRSTAPAARGLPAGELRADLRRAGDGAISGTAELRVGAGTRLTASARLPRGPGADAPLEGTLEGVADLGALTGAVLAARGDRVTGRLALNLRTSGSLAAPVLGGEARLSGGSYRDPLSGVAVTDLNGTLRPEGPRLRADLTGRTAGNGRLAVSGTVEPLAAGLPADLALTATAAQPVASDLVRATFDAELRLAGQLASGATLSGPVRVRGAEIRIPDRLPGSVRSLGPVTERGTPPGRAPRAQPAPARTRPAPGGGASPIALAVGVQAPRGVYVRGRGVDAELGGELAVGGRVDAPEITGELTLRRGDIAVIGRRIAFDRGRLRYTGGLLPELDFRATSQAGSVTARVEVTGTPDRPEITFSSTPDLPQDEILARLLFDRPTRDLSPFENAQLAQALAGATGLAGGGTGGLLDRVRQTLGLDRLAVGSASERAGGSTTAEERSGATLEAGRYVADGVYVGVRGGTEPGTSRVTVRVDLTRRLRLVAETGDREAGERIGVSAEWEWGR